MIRATGSALLILLVACTPWRKTYLTKGVGRLSRDSVTTRLGPPDTQRTLDGGGAVWNYRFTKAKASGGDAKTYCTQYVLVFDPQGMLQTFNQQGC